VKAADAQTLAISLSAEQRKALQIVKGRENANPEAIEPEPLVVLSELGLVRRERLEDQRELLELTVRGRKVAEFV
jgi:hypothetical protein